MSEHIRAAVIGGIIPAILFGISNFIQKFATKSGIGIVYYMIFIGMGMVASGCVFSLLDSERAINFKSGSLAFAVGIISGLGMGLVGYAYARLNGKVSILTPLYNMNSLVAVILGLIIFAEWKEVSMIRVFIGTVMIIAGGSIVAVK